MATFVVVQRGDSETFQVLEKWARKPGSDLTPMWDRRTSDRRHDNGSLPLERRVGERREAVPEIPADFDQARRWEQPQRGPERRQAERRRRAPDTWGVLGFQVIRPECTPS